MLCQKEVRGKVGGRAPRQWRRTKPPSTWNYLRFIQWLKKTATYFPHQHTQTLTCTQRRTHTNAPLFSLAHSWANIYTKRDISRHSFRYVHSSWYSQIQAGMRTQQEVEYLAILHRDCQVRSVHIWLVLKSFWILCCPCRCCYWFRSRLSALGSLKNEHVSVAGF